MATDAAPSRRLSWRPSSVGIGSSLTLSGVSSKPSPYIEKDWNLAISSKPFFLPRVGTGDHRAPSTSRFGEHWKAPQTDAKLVLTCCPMLEPDATDANQQIDQDSLTLTNPELRRWAEKCESYRSEGVLVAPKEQMEDPDKEVLLQLDNVKKQIQRSPENLLISIKAVMAEKRRRIVTAKAAQFGKNHLNDQPQPTMNNCGSDSKMAPRPFPVMTYHEILRAAIVNNCSNRMRYSVKVIG
ncbi:uncharacterized protein [Watersipora subatra]|uniref:uncharacterized protein n=1 Tax=Watersipora subatra TaxID=2589382 RepID=UPI00355B2A7A